MMMNFVETDFNELYMRVFRRSRVRELTMHENTFDVRFVNGVVKEFSNGYLEDIIDLLCEDPGEAGLDNLVELRAMQVHNMV